MMNTTLDTGVVIGSTEEIGSLIRKARTEQGMNQIMTAGLFGSGNRFISDVENGKKTIQAQKLLDLLDMVGLEVVIRRKQSND
jgi:HTH-type transcriptional regulator/antitoxin HipB